MAMEFPRDARCVCTCIGWYLFSLPGIGSPLVGSSPLEKCYNVPGLTLLSAKLVLPFF